jgi:DNA-binding transcriptional ArsR family regulator
VRGKNFKKYSPMAGQKEDTKMSDGDDATKKHKNGGKMNGKNGKDLENEDAAIKEMIQKYLEKKISLKRLSNKARIELLEQGTITLQSFLDTMVPGLKSLWKKIFNLLENKRIIRNTDLAEKFTKKRPIPKRILNTTRGYLIKFEEWNALTRIKRPGEKHYVYYCNLPGFYKPEELHNLSPDIHKVEILKSMNYRWESLGDLSEKLKMNLSFLTYLLDAYAEQGLIEKEEREYYSGRSLEETIFYRLPKGFKEIGVITPNTIKAFSIIRANNLLEEEQEKEAGKKKFVSLEELVGIMEEDLNNKTLIPKDIEIKGDSAKFAFLGELPLGHQFADLKLVDYFLEKLKQFEPDFFITSDFVQGDFKGIQVDRIRTLTRIGLLNKVSVQHKAANFVLKELEKVAKNVVYQLSDDDWQISVSRALIAMEQFLALRRSGLSSIFPEEIKRRSGEDYRRFMKMQWQYIQPYMFRIGRTLYNANEVNAIIGEEISEYLLIVFILYFEKKGEPIPKEWKVIVDMEALHGDKKKSKLSVTPDPIILRLPERFGHKIIHVVHNMGFSNVTQYTKSLQIPESIFRHLQACGMETPYLITDFHQERFFGACIGRDNESKQPTFIFNLPGCKNTLLDASYRMKSFSSFNILTDKVHRQNTFRKEPATPGISLFELLSDGRLRIKILTHKIQQILEANINEPEIKEIFYECQDIQIGSITQRIEWAIKAHDYALYTRGATIVDYNGDIIHGNNYKQHPWENRPRRLTSVASQQEFLRRNFGVFYPAPNVKIIDIRVGNHEYNTRGVADSGYNNLAPFTAVLREKHEGRGLLNTQVSCWNRLRLKNSANPGGSEINWPYTARTVAGGFKYAVQHKWSFGDGDPLAGMAQWFRRMAGSAGDIDLMIGGHYHIFGMALIAEKFLLQLPGLNDQSGYEMQGGFMPQSMVTIIEFSNKEGITIELIPIEFLEKYKCVSPAYKDIDAKGLLDRPKPGTREYDYGLPSPHIYRMEEEADALYPEV